MNSLLKYKIMSKVDTKKIDVIAPSLGRRFSGINASMMAVIPEQTKLTGIVGLGLNLDSNKVPVISFKQFLFGCWRDKWRIWHARRNIDMLTGIILKYVFRYKIVLVFTSVAQRYHKSLTKFYINQMSEIICPSNISASYLEYKPNIVPHGVNTSIFYPSTSEDKQSENIVVPCENTIGIFGRIRKSKGTEEFIDAVIKVLQHHDNWGAVVIGESTPKDLEFKKMLEDKVLKAGLESRIVFTGFLKDSAEIPKWYRAIDIVVCASHNEGFGLPALEAMASKCSVIATKAGAWPEFITDGENGYLVDTKSSEQIAEKLEILMSNDSLRNQIAQNGYNLVTSKYKIENEAEGIQEIYDKLLAEKNKGC